MKATVSILLLAAALFSLPNDLRSERWYSSFSTGNTSSLSGSYEMENFYSPGWSYALDFGFKVNPYLVILPVSFSWREFSFSNANYVANYWDNFDFILEESWAWYNRNGYITSINEDYINKNFRLSSKSTLDDYSLVPAILCYSPEFKGVKGFARVGAGVYLSSVSIETLEIYNNPDRNPGPPHTKKKNNNQFTMLYGGGLEYNFLEKFGLLFEMRYNVIYSGKENAALSLENTVNSLYSNPLLFYYMTPEGLKIHNFMEEKDLKTFDIRYGMTFRF